MHASMLRLLLVSCVALPVASCGDDGSGEQLPVNIIDFTDGDDPGACIQPNFPADQPDLPLFTPPRFLLTTSRAQQSTTGQAQVRPGDPVIAEVAVNGPTRQVFVELADVWDPRFVVASGSQTTSGNETLRFEIPEVMGRGRYYLKIKLCGDDCNDMQVLFETQPCVDGLEDKDCAHNVPYLRTVVRDGLAEEPDPTCLDLKAYPGYGSGTVLIQ